MNLTVNRLVTHDHDVAELPTALAQWYGAEPSIRRLWAIEARDALIVFVALEPTSDGDDTLPVWFANNRAWTNDLKSLTQREVQLQLSVSGVLDKSDVDADAAMIVALDWRDP